MECFRDKDELVAFARDELREDLENTEKVVKTCWQIEQPFAALRECFSILELLAALAYGEAGKNASTSKNLRDYMQKFLGYDRQKSKLLTNMCRHKVVHLREPKPVVKLDGKTVSWNITARHVREQHLSLIGRSNTQKVGVTSKLTVEYDCLFYVDVHRLLEDIKQSVSGNNGLIAKLKNDENRRKDFDKAIAQIHEVECIE